ncbi:MAG: hypothetical protein WCK29_02680 [archaeon]
MRKTLTNLALAGTLALGLAGCTGNPQYLFDGKIGNEKVRYHDNGLDESDHILEVTKENGLKIKYIAHLQRGAKNYDGNDFFDGVDEIEIISNNQTNHYNMYELNMDTVNKIRNTYQEYLGKIVVEKSSRVNEVLTK